MTVNPADRPKVILLIVAIVAFFVLAGFRLMAMLGQSSPPPQPATSANATLPSTNQIASGEIVAKSAAPAENLSELFARSEGQGAQGNPFRMPVPPPRPANTSSAGPPPRGTISVPTQGNPGAPISFGGASGGGSVPFNPGGPVGPDIRPIATVVVKGIIASPDGDSMAFLRVGDTSKGYRIGDVVAEGMKIVDIDETKVSIKVGAKVVRVGVGQVVNPA
ncbi:MAG TPA: hypothetical protein VJ835_04755 [Fimbriimonadaceae bacterium]|nr:hypothetical protein [Fimbriimonadaceae bacterium]